MKIYLRNLWNSLLGKFPASMCYINGNESHNGYKNYETWAVSLWLHNDYDEYMEVIGEAYDYAGESENGVYEFSAWLRNHIENQIPQNLSSGIFADFINASLGEVDWYEISQEFINETGENE